MALPTFTPPVDISAGFSVEPKINVRRNEFGDGYTQASPAGLNHIRDVGELKLEGMTALQAAGVIAFLRERGGYQPFLWTAPNDAAPKRWVSEKWKHVRDGAGWHTITATFEQDFGLAS